MASNKIQKVTVSTVSEMDQVLTGYLAQGFTVANKTATSATLQKKKEFSALWAIVGMILCVLPLLIYLIVYATRPDFEIVEILVI
jgi:hypothetical protein